MTLASLLSALNMGCLCGKESKDVAQRKFYVKTRLGEGGFSYVDLVQDARSRQLFALKRITCHSREDEKVAQQEVDYMRMLTHPNLVPCEESERVMLRAGVSQGAISEFNIVMPYYRRGSLWDEIEISKKVQAPLKEARVLQVLRGVCDGLLALHRHAPPIAHRDVKPQNVMLADDDTPVLMDFGSMGPARVTINNSYQARAMTDMAGERCTMTYRAPELFNVETGSVIDEKVDIWSLGGVLYAMCFGDSPFEDTYIKGGSLALAALSGKLRIPEQHSYSQGLMDLLHLLMSVKAEDRPAIETVTERTEALLTSHVPHNRV